MESVLSDRISERISERIDERVSIPYSEGFSIVDELQETDGYPDSPRAPLSPLSPLSPDSPQSLWQTDPQQRSARPVRRVNAPAEVPALREELQKLKDQAQALGFVAVDSKRQGQRRSSDSFQEKKQTPDFMMFSKAVEQFMEHLGSASTGDAGTVQNRPNLSTGSRAQELCGLAFQDYLKQVASDPDLLRLQRRLETSGDTSSLQQEILKFKDCALEKAWLRLMKLVQEAKNEAEEAVKKSEDVQQRCYQIQTGYVQEVMDVRNQLRRMPQELPSLDVEMWEPLQCLDSKVRGLVEACAEERLRTLLSKTEIMDLVRSEHHKETYAIREELQRQTSRASTLEHAKEEANSRIEKLKHEVEACGLAAKASKEKHVAMATDLQRCQAELAFTKKRMDEMKAKVEVIQTEVQEQANESSWAELMEIFERRATPEEDAVPDINELLDVVAGEMAADGASPTDATISRQTSPTCANSTANSTLSELSSLLADVGQDLGPEILQDAQQAAELAAKLDSPAPVIATLARHIRESHDKGDAANREMASLNSEFATLKQELSNVKQELSELHSRHAVKKETLDASTSTAELLMSEEIQESSSSGASVAAKPAGKKPVVPAARPLESPPGARRNSKQSNSRSQGSSTGEASSESNQHGSPSPALTHGSPSPALTVGSDVGDRFDKVGKEKSNGPTLPRLPSNSTATAPPQGNSTQAIEHPRELPKTDIRDHRRRSAPLPPSTKDSEGPSTLALSAVAVKSPAAAAKPPASDREEHVASSGATPSGRRQSTGKGRPMLGPQWKKVES